MDTIEKQELTIRTRRRNVQTWRPLDFGGVLSPLAALGEALDTLAAPTIENHLAISGEAWETKEGQRDRTIELSQAEVDQELTLADAKVATGRAKIAIESAADEYALAARIYDAKVKGFIMGAKEYAALVEQEQLAVEEDRTGLAIDKEALRLRKVQADTYLQTIEQAQVEADIAKSKVDVAKAHVRAALAGIQAGESEIKLIEAQTQVFIAEAEKSTLQADVASIFAEIMTKQLSTTKLAVGKAEITAGYNYIQSKLDDALAQMDTKTLIETMRTESEKARKEELDLILAVEKAAQDLKLLQEEYARHAFVYEEQATWRNFEAEANMRDNLVKAKLALNWMRAELVNKRETAQNSAAGKVSNAQIGARDKEHLAWSWTTSIEHISG
jgi:hypothetical protein